MSSGRRAPAPDDDASLPPKRIRYAGMLLAVITFMIGAFTFMNAFSAGMSGFGFAASIVVGLLLMALAIGIGLVALVPERVRGWLARE